MPRSLETARIARDQCEPTCKFDPSHKALDDAMAKRSVNLLAAPAHATRRRRPLFDGRPAS